MRRLSLGQLSYFQFESLSPYRNVVHGVFGRRGGVSEGPYRSLNVSLAVGDDPKSVAENRRAICRALAVPYYCLVVTKQVHETNVLTIDGLQRPSDPEEWYRLLPHADGLISREPGYYPMMTFADCVPLVFYDRKTEAVGLSHGGWRGTVGQIAVRTVEAMASNFGSVPDDILVGIGPSIGPCCCEVKGDVISAVERSGAGSEGLLLGQSSGAVHLDLWEMNRRQLIEAGVPASNVEVARLCTACNTDSLFSNRAEGGITGRFGVVVGLRS